MVLTAQILLLCRYYDLVPLAAEDYSGADDPIYYAVAVARRTESHLTIFNLKGAQQIPNSSSEWY